MESRSQDPTAPGVNPSGANPSATTTPPRAYGVGGRFATGADGGAGDEPVTDDRSPAESFKAAQARLSELAEYISYLLSAKVDSYKVTFRNLGIYAVLGIVGLLAAGATVVTAVVMLCVGIASGLGRLFGGHYWLGSVVTGLLILGLIAGGVIFGMRWLTGTSRERTVKKYANRQQQQRARFGQDVRQRASDPAE